MNRRNKYTAWLTATVLGVMLAAANTHAAISGITGPTFHLTAAPGHIDTPDGGSVLVWGYGVQGQPMQYPGPTLFVNQGDTVTINLTNQLPMPVSMVFPGQQGVSVSGGSPGLLTSESTGPADTVTYQFVANHPGTYVYQSGTRPDLQIEMGLVGALIVRPAGAAQQAYGHSATAFDREHLFMLTSMDPDIHFAAEMAATPAQLDAIDTTGFKAVLWFINGRNAPDTLAGDHLPWMPHQPYGSLVRAHPGDTILLRLIGAGRELHPWHTHGNHMRQIARDGRLLASPTGAGPDLAQENYTLKVLPGSTYDALFVWTGAGMGWDIYGHGPDDPLAPNESPEDHGKPLPVVLPENQNLTFGGFYSGSPFLGTMGTLPPGEGGLNPNAGLVFMWHSHTERELVNNDIFPGGMMTMLIIEPADVPIE